MDGKNATSATLFYVDSENISKKILSYKKYKKYANIFVVVVMQEFNINLKKNKIWLSKNIKQILKSKLFEREFRLFQIFSAL